MTLPQKINYRLSTLSLLLLFYLSTSYYSVDASTDKSNKHYICNDKSNFLTRQLDSERLDDFCQTYQGKVILVVNTASRCAFTDQYEDLENLYAEYKDRGLVVVGFPSNDFGNQEPGSEQEIKSFCRLTYGVQFPMYAKTKVTGNDASLLYKKLSHASGSSPQWNFHKYLIARDGSLIGDFNSRVNPGSNKIKQAIEMAL